MKKETASQGRPAVSGTSDQHDVPEHSRAPDHPQDERIVVAVVSKNTREEIRVTLSKFKGIDLIDARVFASQKGDCEGDRVATKKGIAVKVAKLPELIAALQKAEVEARTRGLLK